MRRRAFPERTLVMKKITAKTSLNIINKEHGQQHRNTHLCVSLKTIMQHDCNMKPGKDYQGVLRRDVECEEFHYDEHYTFVETLPWNGKRNPRVYNGRFISVTRRDDGSLRLNFKPLRMEAADFTVDSYALGVCNEIREALEGLVEE